MCRGGPGYCSGAHMLGGAGILLRGPYAWGAGILLRGTYVWGTGDNIHGHILVCVGGGYRGYCAGAHMCGGGQGIFFRGKSVDRRKEGGWGKLFRVTSVGERLYINDTVVGHIQ
jgi:hypothetical protein